MCCGFFEGKGGASDEQLAPTKEGREPFSMLQHAAAITASHAAVLAAAQGAELCSSARG
ncbi:hypothetical protein [Paenibacillus sp. PL91]|uniref:hypothetical protein n=1 Tax=Paenibacillus sp. PL91 TaxID=2729538 RepID=UPI00145C84B1|nr:hypothetical protein [Paenibacillus sp. PL91]MBC9203792.1 hypothetical protein [Paenibacillus sp. PL91]